MTIANSFGHNVQKPNFTSIPLKSEQSHVIPQFYIEQVPTDGIDPETGLRQFRAVEYVKLLIPGGKDAPVKRVNDAIRSQFHTAYQAFKERGIARDNIQDGLPLKAWPQVKPEQAAGLEQINIFTVQQLAGISDAHCSQPGMMGLRDLREKARSFIEAASHTAPIARLEARLAELEREKALRDGQLAQAIDRATELQARLNQLEGGSATAEQPPKLTTPRDRANKEK